MSPVNNFTKFISFKMINCNNDPMFQVIKCEMCPKKATNFVVGLCERCVIIWLTKPRMESLEITLDHIKAAIVSTFQDAPYSSNMDPQLRRVIERLQRARRQKVDLFQKVREKFQESVLLDEFHDRAPLMVEEDLNHIPEIQEEEKRFRDQFNIISDF